ncbi:phage portal protein [Chachezhania sediminis]|uniref:phage portal protein n=1 Tax=Chachezhania sediminis TaxID=2599291 RepID=UPI00131E7F96|nr:phage portal protein [Chachezhania sediminis]
MSMFENLLLAISPRRAAERERHRAIAMHYRASRLGHRNESIRPDGTDADMASRDRRRIAFYIRDMIRNTPMATSIQQVITANVIGDGIIPKINVSTTIPAAARKRIKALGLEMIEEHCDTVDIDKAGLQNLYGLQATAMNTVVDAGEVLIRRHRPMLNRITIPLQLEILEPDYIDSTRWGLTAGGNEIREGIEYDAESGDRVAYWLFNQHPGGEWRPGSNPLISERVPAEDIRHIFRVDRAGQTRGISWYTPIAEKLLHADDAEDAHLMRQKIAACFVAFHHMNLDGKTRPELGGTLSPGTIMPVSSDEDMTFADPPEVGDYSEFQKGVLRSAAKGVGITYEALTGDLTDVNFSSARIGRLEMERNVTGWQWRMLMPMMLRPIGAWIIDAWAEVLPELWEMPGAVKISWVPPYRIIVDPAREFDALNTAVRSGFQSRQGVVRQLGVDPERLLEEQLQDKDEADRLGLPFDSDPRADPSRKLSSFTNEGYKDE